MERSKAWDAYEEAVMAGRGDEVEAPGDGYVMSEAFQRWLVDAMRQEVMGQALGAVADIQPHLKERATVDAAAGGDGADGPDGPDGVDATAGANEPGGQVGAGKANGSVGGRDPATLDRGAVPKQTAREDGAADTQP